MASVVDDLVAAARAGGWAPEEAQRTWIEAEAGRRRMTPSALLREMIDYYEPDPRAYYQHAAAVQSWVAATLIQNIIDSDPGLPGAQWRRELEERSKTIFGPDPLPGGRRPSSASPPRAVLRMTRDGAGKD